MTGNSVTSFAPDMEIPVGSDSRRKMAPEYGSDAIVDLLCALGFKYVFLNPGSSFRGLHDSYVNHGGNRMPQTILCTHETIAVSMGQGYAAATNGPALVTLHDLVGLINGAMGIFNSYAARLPVVVVGGSGPADIAKRRAIEYLHSANVQGEVVRPFVKWEDEATTLEGVLESIARGHKIASTPPRGPVYIALDIGIQEEKLNKAAEPPDVSLPCYRVPQPPAASKAAVDSALDMLLGAERPVVTCGRVGVDPAITAPLVDLLERLGAGYHEDRNSICFPSTHPQNLTGEKGLLRSCDVMLCIDSWDLSALADAYVSRPTARAPEKRMIIDLSMNELASRSWARLGGGVAPTAMQIVADPLLGIEALSAAALERVSADPNLKQRIKTRKLEMARRKNALEAEQRAAVEARWNERPISPPRLVGELWEVVKSKPWLLTLRSHRNWPDGIWEFSGAGQYVGHSGGGGVGHGPGAMVGAALAARDRGQFPVATIGDGDFLMSSGAIWTAVHYKAPLLVVVVNNSSYYNDEEHQVKIARLRGRPLENSWIGTTCRSPYIDIAALAKSYGAWSEGPIEDPAQLRPALERAARQVEAGGVAVLDVRTSAD